VLEGSLTPNTVQLVSEPASRGQGTQGRTRKYKEIEVLQRNQNSVSFGAGNLIDLKEILWEFLQTVFASYISWS
jgi:hypothetical protein